MKLQPRANVSAPIADVWSSLHDADRVVSCLPGATLTGSTGNTASGTIKVRVAGSQVSYRWTARLVERDDAAHRLRLEADGKEMRGPGTVHAAITTTCSANGGATGLAVTATLNVSGGKAAEADEAGMRRLGRRIVSHLADELTRQLSPDAPPAPAAMAAEPDEPPTEPLRRPSAPPPAAPRSEPQSAPRSAPREPEWQPPASVGAQGGGLEARKVAPVAAVLVVLLFVFWRRRRS